MSVVLFRNMLNGEMKRFGKFTKKLYYECNSDDIPIKYVYDAHIGKYKNEIQKGDTLIIVAHGSKRGLFHKYEKNRINVHQYLLDVNNMECLKSNKMIAISCGTAKEFGPESILKGNCTVFLGFLHSIHVNKKDCETTSSYYGEYIKGIYKKVFYNILKKAVIENWTFSKLRNVLEWELKSEAMNSSKKQFENYGENFYSKHGIEQSILAVNNVASSIRIFGDENLLIR